MAHQGVIPTGNEAMAFGQAVIDVVAPVLAHLKCNESEHVKAVNAAHLGKRRMQVKDGHLAATLAINPPLSLPSGVPQATLEDSLNRIRSFRVTERS